MASGVSAYTSSACFNKRLSVNGRGMIAHSRDANPGPVCVGDAADRGASRHQKGVVELENRGREVADARRPECVERQKQQVARAGLEALHGLRRSRMIRAARLEPRCAPQALERPVRSQSPCHTLVAHQLPDPWCTAGQTARPESLPARTRSATRGSGICASAMEWILKTLFQGASSFGLRWTWNSQRLCSPAARGEQRCGCQGAAEG